MHKLFLVSLLVATAPACGGGEGPNDRAANPERPATTAPATTVETATARPATTAVPTTILPATTTTATVIVETAQQATAFEESFDNRLDGEWHWFAEDPNKWSRPVSRAVCRSPQPGPPAQSPKTCTFPIPEATSGSRTLLRFAPSSYFRLRG